MKKIFGPGLTGLEGPTSTITGPIGPEGVASSSLAQESSPLPPPTVLVRSMLTAGLLVLLIGGLVLWMM